MRPMPQQEENRTQTGTRDVASRSIANGPSGVPVAAAATGAGSAPERQARCRVWARAASNAATVLLIAPLSANAASVQTRRWCVAARHAGLRPPRRSQDHPPLRPLSARTQPSRHLRHRLLPRWRELINPAGTTVLRAKDRAAGGALTNACVASTGASVRSIACPTGRG